MPMTVINRSLGFCLLLFACFASAHEVPERVQLRLYLKVEGDALVLLLRAPLEAMRDVDIPQVGPGYVDLARLAPVLDEAVQLWLVDDIGISQQGAKLGRGELQRARISLPGDRAFFAYKTALQHLAAPPLAANTLVFWRQAMVDVELRFALQDGPRTFEIEPALAHLGQRTQSVLTFIDASGAEHLFEYEANPGVLVLDPHWYQVIPGFVGQGMQHLLSGLDHILFLLCLVLPVRRFWRLVAVVTAFTLGHSITLLSAAFGLVPDQIWFPALVEVLIAATIFYVALENILARQVNQRWLLAFIFGLIHGYGFSFQLQESLQLAGSHLVVALLAFNLGVELGQVLLLGVIMLLLLLALRVVSRPQWLVIVVSALVAHSAWHWLTERGGHLVQYLPG